jgi:hypothetical protein
MSDYDYQFELGMAYVNLLTKIEADIKQMRNKLGDNSWRLMCIMDERVNNVEMNIQNISIYQGLQEKGFKVTLKQVSNLDPYKNFVVTHRNHRFYFYPYNF